MPTAWETFPVEIGGGLVSNQPPIQQGIKMPGSATNLVNFEPSIEGGYRRINGYTKFDANLVPAVTASNIILGVGILDNYVIAAREGKVFSSTGSGWTEIATGRTQTTKQRFTIINLNGTKKILGLDGVNYPYTWDKTTFVNLSGSTDIQGASHAVEFKNHVFYAKGSLVTFSVPFDEDDFTPASGGGSFQLTDNVTGLIVFRNNLIIFTPKEIHAVTGSSVSDFVLSSVAEEVGCIAPDTIQEVGGDIAFLSADGVRLLGATERIGDFANGLTTKVIQSDFLTFRQRYDTFSSCLVRGKSQYRIFGYESSLPADVTDGYIGVQFDPQDHESFQWSEIEGIKAYSADSTVFNGRETIVFSGDSGYVYTLESGSTFDGTPIVAQYWTPYFSFSDPKLRKVLYKLTMYFSPEGTVIGDINVNFNQDSMGTIQPRSISFSATGGGSVYGAAVFDTDVFASAPDTQIIKQLVGSGYNASFQFSFTEEQDPFTFDTILVEYSQEDRK